MKEPEKYTVIRDSKEKKDKGFWFEPNDVCNGTEVQGLPTGDYSIKGFEDIFVVERKASTAEFGMNVFEKRFEREMERLEEFKHPFLLFEFSREDIIKFPVNSGIPPRFWNKLKVSGKYMLSVLDRYLIQYKTKVIFAGTNGKKEIERLFSLIVKYAKKT